MENKIPSFTSIRRCRMSRGGAPCQAHPSLSNRGFTFCHKIPLTAEGVGCKSLAALPTPAAGQFATGGLERWEIST